MEQSGGVERHLTLRLQILGPVTFLLQIRSVRQRNGSTHTHTHVDLIITLINVFSPLTGSRDVLSGAQVPETVGIHHLD